MPTGILMRSCTAILTFLFLLMVTCAGGCRKVPNYGTSPVGNVNTLELMAWQADPLVKVCPRSPFTKDEVQWALDLWASHGAPQLLATNDACFDQDKALNVYVDVPYWWMMDAWEPNMRAGTFTFTEKGQEEGPVALAFIAFPPNVGDKVTLVHEVGHIWLAGHADGTPLSPFVENFEWEWKAIDKALRR